MSEAPTREPPQDDDAPPEDEPQGRPQPADDEAEQWVLSSMIQDSEAIALVTDTLRPRDYYRPLHEHIHEAILYLYSVGEPVDVVTLRNRLDRSGHKVDPTYLFRLSTYAAAPAAADYYARIVAEHAVRRRLIEVGQRSIQRGYDVAQDASALLDAAEADLMQVATTRRDSDYMAIGTVVEPVIDQIEAAGQGVDERIVSTGFLDLDDLLGGGLLPGQMVTVAGRPGMGKSVLGVDFLRACSLVGNRASVLFSLEMDRREIVTRIIAAQAKVPLNRLRKGDLDDHDWGRVGGVVEMLRDAPLFIDDSPNLTMTEIRSKARRLRQRHEVRLVVIDYLQLMTSGTRVESRQVEVSEFSRQIKLLAKEIECPVVAISQLNRGPEQRTSKRPMLADLRESGSIEQDSDIVMLLHRDDYYERESPRLGEADIIVAKQRGGPTRDVVVAAQLHYARLVDMAR